MSADQAVAVTSSGAGLRVLTLWQPWAAYIAVGAKTIENRNWRPASAWRGLLAIHAGLSVARWPQAGEVEPGSLGRAALAEAPAAAREHALTRGAIVAVARLAGCHRGDRCTTWAEPAAWHWELADVTATRPVPCRGQRGLWTPAPALLAAITAAYRDAHDHAFTTPPTDQAGPADCACGLTYARYDAGMGERIATALEQTGGAAR